MKSYQALLSRRQDRPHPPQKYPRHDQLIYQITAVREANSLEEAREIFQRDFSNLYTVDNVVNYLSPPDLPAVTTTIPQVAAPVAEWQFDQMFVD